MSLVALFGCNYPCPQSLYMLTTSRFAIAPGLRITLREVREDVLPPSERRHINTAQLSGFFVLSTVRYDKAHLNPLGAP